MKFPSFPLRRHHVRHAFRALPFALAVGVIATPVIRGPFIAADLNRAHPANGASIVAKADAVGGQMLQFGSGLAPAPPPAPAAPPVTKSNHWALTGIKEVSYYPAVNPWQGMWSTWQPKVIDADFAKIAALHANTVRLFIQPDVFGYPTVNPTREKELQQTVALASNHGLRVRLNLFDAGFYAWWELARSQQWASGIMAPFAGDPRIAFVEVLNEIDPNQEAEIKWAKVIIPYVRSLSGGIPVAISVCGCNTIGPLVKLKASLGSVQPDAYSFHFYAWDPQADPKPQVAAAAQVFALAKAAVAPLPLFIGETGISTAEVTEHQQAVLWEAMAAAAIKGGVDPPGVWTLNDFTVADAKNNAFGLYHYDGSPKPAAAVVAQMFAR